MTYKVSCYHFQCCISNILDEFIVKGNRKFKISSKWLSRIKGNVVLTMTVNEKEFRNKTICVAMKYNIILMHFKMKNKSNTLFCELKK